MSIDDKKLAALVKKGVMDGVTAALLEARGDITEVLYRKANPPVYKKGNKRPSFPKPSKPGRPPATRYGAAGLAGSIVAEKARQQGQRIFGRIGTNREYAAPLEFGSPVNGLAPRPFMRPTLTKKAKKYGRIISSEMLAYVKRGLPKGGFD